jgi:hypothetical protein
MTPMRKKVLDNPMRPAYKTLDLEKAEGSFLFGLFICSEFIGRCYP